MSTTAPSKSTLTASPPVPEVEAARVAARLGNLDEARRLLRAAIRRDRDCVQAWLGLAWLAQTPQKREALLYRVLALEPQNLKAQQELARCRQLSSAATARDATPPSRSEQEPAARRRRWSWALLPVAIVLLGAIGLVLLQSGVLASAVTLGMEVLLPTPQATATPAPTVSPAQVAGRFVPQLQVALAGGSWDRALEIVAIMQSLDPADDAVRRWSLETHMRYGRALVQNLQADKAQSQFDLALALAPDSGDARLWQDATQVYLSGRRALDAGNWTAAIEAFITVQDEMPGYADASDRLVEAYRRQGETAIEENDWTLAIESLTLARERAPGDATIVELLAEAYRLQGQAAIDAKDWDLAVQAMTQAHEQLPEEQSLVDLLAQAYRQRGIAEEASPRSGMLQKARADLEAALALRPDDAEAKTHLDRVMYRLFPPKKIVIDISEQRMYVYEGDTLKWKYVISTGLPGRDTATGNYQVLDKIPMAYSAIWRLKMPYWLGIYYVGRVENGIHALPIRPDGSVMWGGLLGTRQSYGCVILNNQAARSLYDWAEIGTVVNIRY